MNICLTSYDHWLNINHLITTKLCIVKVYRDDDNLFVHPEWQLRQQCPEIWQTLSLSPQLSVERSPGQTWLHPRPRPGGGDSWSAPPRQAGPSDNQTRARRTSKNVDEQPTIGSVYGGGGVNLKRAYFSHQGKEIHRRNLQTRVPRELPTSGTRKEEKTLFNFKLRPNVAWYWFTQKSSVDPFPGAPLQCLCWAKGDWNQQYLTEENHILGLLYAFQILSCVLKMTWGTRIDITWRWRSLEVVTLWIELPLCWCTPSQFCILYLFFHLPNFVFQIFYFPFHLFTLAS